MSPASPQLIRIKDGGASEDEAFACSGGRQDDRDGCFDLRLMWR